MYLSEKAHPARVGEILEVSGEKPFKTKLDEGSNAI